MGSQCSRSSPGAPTRGLLTHLSNADREPRDREASPPRSNSISSADDEPDCDSIVGGPLSFGEGDASNGVAPPESALPSVLSESCAFSRHAPDLVGGSFETALPKSTQKGNRTRSRLLTHSLPDRIDAEDERLHVQQKLPTTVTVAVVSENVPQSAASRTFNQRRTCSGQPDNFVSVADPSSPYPNTKLDETTRKMFLEFYNRNREEQKRHEQVLKAASRVVDHSSASCPVFFSAATLETIQEEPVRSRVPPDILARQKAEAMAVEALDVFSPDEKYTRLDEFLLLVNTIQSEYQSERHRGLVIRGPNRASTFGQLPAPPGD